MRKLYNEFFYIPKHGKIREKVMLTRVAMTVVIMVICLAAMSITAYAYFSHNVTSGSNIIKAASFYTDVTVQITAEDGAAVNTITTNTSDYKSHSAELTANKTYTVTVQHNERSTAQTGFVIVTAEGCETSYHTQQLGRDGNGNTHTISFKLTPDADTVVTFRSHWGTSSFYADFKEIGENDERYIIDGEDVELTVKGLHVHDYEATITAPTCTEQGYTTYSCACGDIYKDDYVDANGHSYKRITCTTCGETHPNAGNYEGKVISIMGDSISSFKGYIPVADGFNEEHPYAYPGRGVNSWDQTWWGLVIEELDAKLGINDSWSGSYVHNSSTADNPGWNIGAKVCMPSITRVSNLGANGTPDVILVYGGTNDGKSSPFGGFDPSLDYSQVDLDAVTWKTFEDAYVAMIMRMQHYYPEAKIIALLPTPVASWYTDEKLAVMNSSIKEICEYFGIDYVDLPECGITLADLPDGLHPNAAGMSYIADAVLEVLLNTPEEAGENIVHSITHNLNGAKASKGHYKGVSNNKSFEETLTGELEFVSVTMNGVDITESCYENGTIYIQHVTGDVVITVGT